MGRPFSICAIAVSAAFAAFSAAEPARPVRLRTRDSRPVSPSDGTTPRPGLIIVQRRAPSPPDPEWRAALERAGARIHGYLPENAYLAAADGDAVRRIADCVPDALMDAYLPSDKRVAAAVPPDREFLVIVFDPSGRRAVSDAIRALEGCAVIDESGEIVRARLTPEGADAVALRDDVVWLDLSVVNCALPSCDRACGEAMMDFASVWPADGGSGGLTGRGQVIAVADTGLDTGDFATLHEDLRGRVSRAYALGRKGDWSDPLAHGTHICGAAAGSGARSGGRVKGPAFEATLIVQSLFGAEGGSIVRPANVADLYLQAYEDAPGAPGARIHSDSWGAGRDPGPDGAELLGVYIEDCRATDAFCFGHPDFLVLFASGNDAVDADGDGVIDADSLNSQATSKNAVTVGGVENVRRAGRTYGMISPSRYPADPIAGDDVGGSGTGAPGMAAFSGRGPCDDGRIKPDVTATATMVAGPLSSVSGRGEGAYHFKNGTSMAVPIVAGAAALVRQSLAERAGIGNPDAATVKAMLVAGARSISPGQYGDGRFREIPETSPNHVEGWGLVDVARSVAGAGVRVCDGEIAAQGDVRRFTARVPAGARLAVALAWTDAPAELAAARQLVNDFDLKVVSPSGKVFWPNGGNAPDRLNNVETVKIAASEDGEYVVEVEAKSIPVPMDAALTGGRAGASRFSLVMNWN